MCAGWCVQRVEAALDGVLMRGTALAQTIAPPHVCCTSADATADEYPVQRTGNTFTACGHVITVRLGGRVLWLAGKRVCSSWRVLRLPPAPSSTQLCLVAGT